MTDNIPHKRSAKRAKRKAHDDGEAGAEAPNRTPKVQRTVMPVSQGPAGQAANDQVYQDSGDADCDEENFQGKPAEDGRGSGDTDGNRAEENVTSDAKYSEMDMFVQVQRGIAAERRLNFARYRHWALEERLERRLDSRWRMYVRRLMMRNQEVWVMLEQLIRPLGGPMEDWGYEAVAIVEERIELMKEENDSLRAKLDHTPLTATPPASDDGMIHIREKGESQLLAFAEISGNATRQQFQEKLLGKAIQRETDRWFINSGI
ncbi:hypothetical protein B0I35DRAFT_405667 [Stachybotrys elegans]|uniref:Uncharacterized protein n=1 Tax=Stachybotrys elegans TaxID=80388 RepID=A0A8K0T009_9HYPO|nr:hypothetical protein B0I35DRAFT_405667 [Stachybotrys elegans]